MKALITVLAHGKALGVFRMHMPLWEMHELPIEVWCPTDDRIPDSECDYPITPFGLSEHHGDGMAARINQILLMHSRTAYDYHLLLEYDSFVLGKEIAFRPGFTSNLYYNKEPNRFFGHVYGLPPWMLDAVSLRAMEATARRHPNVREEGFADRQLAALSLLAGVKLSGFEKEGFSRATIGIPDIGKMRELIVNGATMLHGFKDKWVTEAALAFYKERNPELAKREP